MATVALSVVGSYFGPAGQALGAAVGSYIDQQFLYPMFQDDVEGPRLGELQLQGADEGSPINFSSGPECRMPGTIIWVSQLIEVKSTEEAGGKGGGPEIESYAYYVDIAISAGKFGKAIQSFSQIWGEGKLLYDSDPDVDYTATNLAATVRVFTRWNPISMSAVEYKRVMTVTSPDGGNDLSKFVSGKQVVSSGWSQAGNNGTFKCKRTTFDTVTGISTVVLDVTGTAAADDPAGDTVTLFQDLPTHSTAKIQSLSFYLGTDTQVADSQIESHEGSGNVPGFRGTAYAVLTRLAIADFGNRVPNFTVLVEVDTSQTVGGAISAIAARSGRPSTEFDVTGLTDSFRGYTIRGPQPISQSLQPVLMGYDVLASEDQGVMTFFSRSAAATKTITATDLAAHEIGGDAPRPFEVTDPSSHNLPSEVTVRYFDPDTDYQWGSQRERRIRWTSNSRARTALPLVMTAAEARDIAARLLWTPWANNQQIKLSLPPSYIDVQVNDRLSVTAFGKAWIILVTKVDYGWNHVIQVEGVEEQAAFLSFTSVAEEPTSPSQSFYLPPATTLVLMDIGPLSDNELFKAGFYFGVTADDPNVQFAGGQLFESSDGGSNFTFLQSVGTEANIGTTSDTLGDATTGFWDRESTVTVVMSQGSLSSKTEIEVLNGANRALCGTEVIGFMTATLTGTNTYELSDLIRGLLDTRDQTGNHQTGEEFVALNALGIGTVEQNISAVGQARSYKFVPTGSTLTDEDEVTLTPNANAMRPYRPTDIRGTRDGSNNLTIDWIRCNRASVRIFAEGGVGLTEPSEAYEIDILTTPGGTVLRTISVTASTASYTAAEQTTDGLTPGNTVHLAMYQIGNQIGRGNEATASI